MGQHYIPQHYLRQFAVESDEDMIWMFDKRKRDFKLLPIKNVAQKSGFYFEEDERALNEQVESPASQPLSKLNNGRDVDRGERLIVAMYLQALYFRVPRARTERRNYLERELTNMVNRWEDERLSVSHQSKLYYDQVQSVSARWKKDNLEELPRQDVRELLMRLPTSDTVVDLLSRMTWRVLRSENNDAFITSDNPCFVPKRLGLDNFDAELSVPLSSTTALHMSWQGKPETTLTISAESWLVKEINRRTVRGSDRFLFHHRNEEWITKTILVAKPRVRPLRW